MIRREVTLDDGRPGWALISQVEHARLAAEVADCWVGPAEPSLSESSATRIPFAEPHAELLAAVLHHDDGWLAWELRPTTVDGRPRDFMEMPLDESLAIWRRSIAVAQNLGPLAAYAVGSHFAALCRWAHAKAGHTESWLHLAEEFIEEQDELARERLAEMIAAAGVDAAKLTTLDSPAAAMRVEEVKHNADRAWHALQFFDRVSLWICCAARSEPETIAVPESLGTGLGAFRFVPLGGDAHSAEISIEPWPLDVDRLDVATVAAVVLQAGYDSPDALARAVHAPFRLNWTFRRS